MAKIAVCFAPKTTKRELETATHGHILAQTKLTGLYTRQKK